MVLWIFFAIFFKFSINFTRFIIICSAVSMSWGVNNFNSSSFVSLLEFDFKIVLRCFKILSYLIISYKYALSNWLIETSKNLRLSSGTSLINFNSSGLKYTTESTPTSSAIFKTFKLLILIDFLLNLSSNIWIVLFPSRVEKFISTRDLSAPNFIICLSLLFLGLFPTLNK